MRHMSACSVLLQALTCCFAEVGDDLSPLDTCVVVLVDQQGLDDHQDLVHIRPHQLI